MVTVDFIDAGTTVETFDVHAIVNVGFASRTSESTPTTTLVRIPFVRASSIVQAWIGRAVVHFSVAMRPSEPDRTTALEALRIIFAGSTVVTFRLFTSDSSIFTVVPSVTFGTLAAVAYSLILTNASVETRVLMGQTSVHGLFAIGSLEPSFTVAGVRPQSGVVASPAVLARLVVGAIIEILVAEQTTPTFVADALPLLLACPVQTSGIPFALVAQLSCPTPVTSAKKKTKEINKQ